jgi:hypothetical protein
MLKRGAGGMRYYPRVVWCGLLFFYAVSGVTLVSAGPIGVIAPKPVSSAETAYRHVSRA